MFKWLKMRYDLWRLHLRQVRSQNRFFRPKARARYRSRLVWYVRQLFPLTYWSAYYGPVEGKYFAIWKMWFGRCYRITNFQIIDDRRYSSCLGCLGCLGCQTRRDHE